MTTSLLPGFAMMTERSDNRPIPDSRARCATETPGSRLFAVLLVWMISSRIEAADAPRLMLNASGHTSMVRKVLFTPDGTQLISVSDDKTIRRWDVSSGETLGTLYLPIGDGNEGRLYSDAISPDGEWLAVGGYGSATDKYGTIYLVSLKTLQISRLLKGHENAACDLAFSSDGQRLISGGGDNTARIWRIADGQCESVLRGHTAVINGVAFSPDGKRCATASYDHTAAIWPVRVIEGNPVPQDRERFAEMRGHQDVVYCIAWSPDGKSIATGSFDQTIRLWDAEGNFVKPFDKLGEQNIVSVTFTADSQKLLFSQGSGKPGKRIAGILDLSSGKTVVEFDKHTNSIMHGTLSRDGTLAATCGGDNEEIWIWRTADGSVVQKLVGQARVPWSAAWSPEGNAIAWGNTNQGLAIEAKQPLERSCELVSLELGTTSPKDFVRARFERGITRLQSSGKTTVDVMRGEQRQTTLQFATDYERQYNKVNCFTLLSGERAAVGASFGLYLFDTRTGERIREFQGHTGEVWAVSTSPDGRYLLSASGDTTLRIWDPERELPLVSLFFTEEDWIAWTPEGYYASSPGGEKLMGWHVNHGPDKMASFMHATQFRATFYRPDVIKLLLKTGSLDRALDTADRARGRMTEKTDVAAVLPPTVLITSHDAASVTTDTAEITIRALAQQAGLHPITSMQILLDGSPLGGRAGIKPYDRPQRELRERFIVPLVAGTKHIIQVRADSAVSYGLSTPIEVTYKTPEVTLPALYILAIGVKDYENKDLTLSFADEDARRIERTFRECGKPLFRSIETKVIVNKDATQRGILSGLSWLTKKVNQNDIGVVFFSGHGGKNETGSFFLMPYDVDQTDLLATGVSDSQIKSALLAVAGRRILMLDACHAGAAAGDRREKSPVALTDDLVRDLCNDDFGVIVMASSMGREVSLESTSEKSGYFTQALTEGLSGKADANGDKVVNTNELDAYVTQRVNTLSNGKQHPVTTKPGTIRAIPLAKQ